MAPEELAKLSNEELVKRIMGSIRETIDAARREAAAEEREACAKLADEQEIDAFGENGQLRQYIGNAIRARK